MFIKYKYTESLIVKKLNTGRDNLLKANSIAMIIGGISAVCMDGVASFQFHNVLYVHLSFAASFFLLAIVHIFIMNILDFKVSKESRHLLRFRLFCALFAVAAFVPMVALNLNQESFDQNVSAVAEISCLGILFVHFITYIIEFRKFRLSIELFHHEEYEKINSPSTGSFETKRFLY